MKELDLDKYVTKEEQVYQIAMILAKRARQVHDKLAEELKAELGELDNEEEQEEELEERKKIVDKFDTRPKPIQKAMEEYVEDKLNVEKKEETE